MDNMVDAWMAAWNAGTPDDRLAFVAQCWAGGGSYTDPFASADGIEEIAVTVGTLIGAFPGHRVERISGVESHGRWARWAWQLVDPAGTVVSDGIDVARCDFDGRFVEMVGFASQTVPVPLAAT